VEEAMGVIAKVLFLPFFIMLPWVVIKVNHWDHDLLNRLSSQPGLILMLLLPSIYLSIRWFVRIIRNK
jgi:hypothetical protein